MAAHQDLDDLLDRLRAEGARITPARRQVLQTLVEAGSEHLTAEQIASRIHATNPDLHVSTIYRTLDFLEDSGAVIRAGIDSGFGVSLSARSLRQRGIGVRPFSGWESARSASVLF